MLPSTHAAESTHWYTREGVPMYTVIGKNGKSRFTNLRDARAMNLVPSVTTILGVTSKPGLDNWKQRQILLSALTLSKMVGETEDDYLERIVRDSKEQGKKAAELGTEIHEAIQSFYENKDFRYSEEVMACDREIIQNFGDLDWIAERSFCHELGYGGKVDLHADGVVIDIKSKEFNDPSKVEGFEEHLMQLAAYRVGLGMPQARCANVFVSRTVPGLVKSIEWTENEIQQGFRMFCHLLSFWQERNKHQ